MKIASALLLAPGLLFAQATTSTTTCSPLGTAVTCRSTTRPAVGEWDWLVKLGARIQADADHKRLTDAIRAQREAEAARASAASSREFDQQWALYWPRAKMLMYRAIDSVGFGGGRADSVFWNDLLNVVAPLFLQSPTASNQQIWDSIEPVYVEYRNRRDAFDRRAIAILKRVSDSLRLKSGARDTFWARASAPLLWARHEEWRTNDYMLRYLVDTVVEATRTKLALDSARARVRKKPPT